MNNNKGKLNEYCQRRSVCPPDYSTVPSGSGFISTVKVEGKEYVSLAIHGKKKEAEQDAAGVAFAEITGEPPVEKLTTDMAKVTISPPSMGGGNIKDGVYRPPSSPRNYQMPPLTPAIIPIPTEAPTIEPPSIEAPLVIDGPSIEQLAPSVSDLKKLEHYCSVSGLPSPEISVKSINNQYQASIKIGGREFSRNWWFESFEDAKECASVVAMAGLAMVKILEKQGQSCLPFSHSLFWLVSLADITLCHYDCILVHSTGLCCSIVWER